MTIHFGNIDGDLEDLFAKLVDEAIREGNREAVKFLLKQGSRKDLTAFKLLVAEKLQG